MLLVATPPIRICPVSSKEVNRLPVWPGRAITYRALSCREPTMSVEKQVTISPISATCSRASSAFPSKNYSNHVQLCYPRIQKFSMILEKSAVIIEVKIPQIVVEMVAPQTLSYCKPQNVAFAHSTHEIWLWPNWRSIDIEFIWKTMIYPTNLMICGHADHPNSAIIDKFIIMDLLLLC